MKRFDPMTVPLEGLQLVEASAGTGKTYSIVRVFLRLVVEKGLAADRILVVTFTEAATAELRARIRDALVAALAVLDGRRTGDADLKATVDALARRVGAPVARARLRAAILGLDRAAISTIHGFCKRTLEEHAFESGARFDVELVSDLGDLVARAVADHFATSMHGASSLLVKALQEAGVDLAFLESLVENVHARPDMEIVRAPFEGDEAGYLRLYTDAREIWAREADAIRDLLRNAPGLSRRSWNKNNLERWCDELNDLFASEVPLNLIGEKSKEKKWMETLARFTASSLDGNRSNGHDAPRHPFFDACEAFVNGGRRILDGLVAKYALDAVDACHKRLDDLKEERKVRSFDDLIRGIAQALAKEGSDAPLTAVLRSAYGAAMIDEFQDTDPSQYAIFRRLFHGTGAPFFLIGDPKQSIFDFRGADLFTYLTAAADAREDAHTLAVNWRSDPALTGAVNLLFSRVRSPFLYEGIGFLSVEPRAGATDRFRLNGARAAPLRIAVFDESQASGKTPAKGGVGGMIPRAVAIDIARLLDGRATIEGRDDPRVRPSDIAVLVRENAQASDVQKELARLGVNSVASSNADIFKTREAEDLLVLLGAIDDPSDSGKVRAALATSLIGKDAAALSDMDDDDRAQDLWGARFEGWRRLWRERGFAAMFQEIMRFDEGEGGVAVRALAGPSGERRSTNLEHLAQLLEQESKRSRHHPEIVARWLARRVSDGGETNDEAALRIESDREAVRIVTVHKAKGLEYPIVYLPYAWSGKTRDKEKKIVRYHDPLDGNRAKIAVLPEKNDPAYLCRSREDQAEEVRLLYVAMTRAAHMCKVFWGRVNGWEATPLGYLLHNPSGELDRDAVTRRMKELDDEGMKKDLREIEAKSGGAIVAEDVDLADVERYGGGETASGALSARKMRRGIARPRTTSSFTRIVADAASLGWEDGEDRDVDHVVPTTVDRCGEGDAEAKVPLADFEASARAGTSLHEILEHADLQETRREVMAREVGDRLARHGFDAAVWRDPVARAVFEVLSTPLDEADAAFTLSSIEPVRMARELEFMLAVERAGGVDAAAIASAMERGCGEVLPRGYLETVASLGFAPFEGFLKGFIDLVFERDGRFYIVDYKSNHLGSGAGSYRQDALVEEMARHHYFLQYHLYAVALHRHLAATLAGYDYDARFGGVFYLFLRGMSPKTGPTRGVFRDRPPAAVIRALSEALGGGEEREGRG